MARRYDSKSQLIDAKAGRRSDWLVFVAVRGLVAVVGRIPRTLTYWVCEGCALLVYAIDSRHRRIGQVNLSVAFPEQDEKWRRRVLRSSFKRLADHFVELCHLPRISTQEIKRRVSYDPANGLDNYRMAREQGKGVIFLTAHVSAWELLPLAHAVLGHPLSFVVRPLDNPLLDRWLTRTRSRFGNQVIEKESSLRYILRLLRESEDVGLLMDQNVQEKDGVFVPLFGKQACTTAGPAALALRTGAPVVLGFLLPRRRKGHYRIRFYPALQVTPSGNREADLVKFTAIFNSYIEEVIRENADCWLWGHRRFRTQKDGHDLYE